MANSVANEKRQTLSGPGLLHNLIAATVDDGIAVDYLSAHGQRIALSYSTFNQCVNLLAHDIRRHFSTSRPNGAIIPVIIPQCPELYVAWSAVLVAGGGFCPISLDVPTERLKFIIKDVEATLFLCLSENTDQLSACLPESQCLSVTLTELRSRSTKSGWEIFRQEQDLIISPESAAYVMYTSGSTGLPKGVKVSHRSVTQSLMAHDEHIPRFKRFLQFASPTFDVSIFEVFFPLFRGATLVGCHREQMLADLPGIMRNLNVDAAELTPTVAGNLLRTRTAAPCLKLLLTIGEMLTSQVVKEFGGSDENESILYAMYGPTEASIHCTIAPKLPAVASVRSIGQPLSTVTTLILKKDIETSTFEILPRGEEGELAIAGQLADGYLNRPQQTKDAFISIPGYGAIYRTGDRAVCRTDGQLEILGRISGGQVKIRGQRVELGEIEEVASKTKGVHLAIAMVIDDLLVLFCAAEDKTQTSDIQVTCKAWLPTFMRPGEIIMLKEDVPRLPSGKVDRKGLEILFRNRSQVIIDQGQKCDFDSEIERNIAQTFQQILGHQVSPSTSFWTSGLDSIKAIEIASRLRHFYPDMSVPFILDSSNVAELASKLDSVVKHSPLDVVTTFDRTDEWKMLREKCFAKLQFNNNLPEDILPCSAIQIGMLAETSRDKRLYYNRIKLCCPPRISQEDLWNAFHQLATGNQILRSGFMATDHSEMPFVQVVWQSLDKVPLDLLHPFQITNFFTSEHSNTIHVGIHHAIYDGWSWDLILHDVDLVLSGKSPPVRPSYKKVSAYEQQLAISEDNSDSVNYWQEVLQDVDFGPFPNLNSKHIDSPCRVGLKRTLTSSYAQLTAMSNQYRVSRQCILLGAWTFILSSYIDNSSPVIGLVSSGRHLGIPDVDKIIGPCLSTLPFRLDLTSVRTCRDLIEYAHRLHIEALQFSNVTLHDIQRCIGLDSPSKLFDTIFVWQQSQINWDNQERLISTVDTLDELDYSMVLEVEPRNEDLVAKITVNNSRIPEAHAQLLLSQLDHIVNRILFDSTTKLDQLGQQLSTSDLSIANSDFTPFNNNFDLFTTITRLAKEYPNASAIEFVEHFDPVTTRLELERLSYKELRDQALRISEILVHDYKILPNTLICIITSKSIGLYITILASVMTGAGYMCIDTRTPYSRIDQILAEAKAELIITDVPEVKEHLIKNQQKSVTINELSTNLDGNISFQPPKSKEHHVAYTVFTSGSTGTPKGVVLTRRNLLSNLQYLSTVYPCNPTTDRLLQSCSPAFDVSVFEIFWTWHMGMTLCTASNDVLFRDIEKLIDNLEVTHLSMTPSVAALVHPDAVPKVKLLVTAGEPMNAKVFTTWAGRGLFQGYGPSETTNICNIRANVGEKDISNNVGPPFSNTSLFICKRQDPSLEKEQRPRLSLEHFKLVPKGCVGEVWIGGDQVARGYVDPILTRNRFLTHPKYGQLYRSGDIGRLLSDNSLLILGREDDQIKLRGQRIELGEINTCLQSADIVKDAISIVVNENTNQARLVSFWTATSSEGQDGYHTVTKRLFQRLEIELPIYMIPDAVILVPHVPLTNQGKIDKKHLARCYLELGPDQLQEVSRHNEVEEHEIAYNEDEKAVVQAISRTLQISSDTVKRNSSLYGLGLDSINAIRLSHHLRDIERFRQVDVSAILKNPSVQKLLPLLQSPSLEGEKKDSPLIHGISRKLRELAVERYQNLDRTVLKVLPCTPLQIAMLSDSANQAHSSYINTLQFRIYGDSDKLRLAWSLVVQRNEILRTAFIECEDPEVPYAQVVLNETRDLWGGEAEAKDAQFDTLGLPPYRLYIETHSTESPRLILRIHHAIYDAEGISILLSEVETIYRGQSLKASVPFSRYLDYMTKINEDEASVFWKNQFSGFAPARIGEVLIDGRKLVSSQSISKVSQNSLDAVETCARQLSTTTLAIFQCAMARLLCCYLQTSDVCFGNVYSGRNLPIEGVERIIGPCFNTLPVRTRISDVDSNAKSCQNLHQNNIDLLRYQTSSLRHIQRQNSPDGRSLFDILLLLQYDQTPLDEQIWSLVEDSGDMSFPFILEIVPVLGSLKLQLHSQYSDVQVLHQMLDDFDTMLNHITTFPRAKATDYSMIDHSRLRIDRSKMSSHPKKSAFSRAPLDSNETWSEIEKVVKHMFLDLTHQDNLQVSRDTTIFQAGLDSINAVQMAVRLRKQGYHISSAQILESPRLADIATVCQREPGTKTPSSSFDVAAFDRQNRETICNNLSISSSDVQAVIPCTSTQNGILSQFIRSQGKLYWNRVVLELEPGIDINSLRQSWRTVVQRQEILRTGFYQLDDPKYPFAMFIYHADKLKLPSVLEEERKAQSQSGDHSTLNSPYLKNMERPGWQLRYRSQAATIYLELDILHALYDATSLDILLAEVSSLYRGNPLARPISVPSAASAILDSADSEESRRFWRDAAQKTQVTLFPDMRIFHSHRTDFHTQRRRSSLSLDTVDSICANQGFSLQAYCQTAWARLLSAYTGQNQVTFGMILSGRDFDDADLNNVAFPCINTVPCPVDIKALPDMLQEISKQNIDLFKHQRYPITSIKRALNIQGELFDTILVLQKYQHSYQDTRPWKVVEDYATAEFVISLEVFQDEESRNLIFQITCHEGKVPQEFSTTILEHFDNMLSEVFGIYTSEYCMQLPAMASILPPKDERLEASVRYLHEFVETAARDLPEKIALEFVKEIQEEGPVSENWTFAQLDEEGNRIAHLLQRTGVESGEMVAICFDKCPEALFAILGVLKAGCAYVAIDPDSPDSRKLFILDDAGCSTVLTTDNISVRLPSMKQVRVLAIDNEHLLKDLPRWKLDIDQLQPDDTCYCLYTSGTTGTPKGCLISHDSAVQAMLSFSRIFEGHWNERSRWLQFASFHFDVSVLEQYWSWSVGIPVIQVPRDILFEDLPGVINKLEITHLDLTPSLARMLNPETVPSLVQGVFIVGGEQVGQDILDTWGDAGCLYNFYGPSEVTIGCTVHPRVQRIAKSTNIGQQWDNVGSIVLEPESERPVLRGAIGELCLSGPLVGKGYLNRLELTKEKFVMLEDYGIRVYRTGDLVRLLHDNSFEFLGRIDDQVKLRGQRLEIGEINHVVLGASDKVKDVATLVLKHPIQARDQLVTFFSSTERRLKAQKPTILADQETSQLLSSIREHCSTKLPGYMIPSTFLAVSSLPLSVNNKIDNKPLRQLFEQYVSSNHNGNEYLGNVQETDSPVITDLKDNLERFLDLPKNSVEAHSSLFELGLDSISAIAFSRILKKRGYRNANVSTILRNSIVIDLASALSDNSQNTENHEEGEVRSAQDRIVQFADKYLVLAAEALGVSQNDIERIAPCTPLQEGMILRAVSSRPEDTVYFSQFSYDLKPSVNIEQLLRAWKGAQSLIGILRTHFVPTEDGYAQVIIRPEAIASEAHLTEADNSPSLKNDFTKWVRTVKAFSKQLPWCIRILHTWGKSYMSLSIFHGLYDGISLPMIIDKVAEIYRNNDLSVLKVPDFLGVAPYGPLLIRSHAKSFWKSELTKLKLLSLPERVLAESEYKSAISIKKTISSRTYQGICNQIKVTPAALFHAAWLLTLFRKYHVNPTIGIVVSGRSLDIDNAESVIGPMFNTLPSRITVTAKDSKIGDLILACHQFNVNTIPFQHTPLRDIAKWIDHDIRHGLFDTLFVFQREFNSIKTHDLWRQVAAQSIPDYPLNLEIVYGSEQAIINLVAKPEYVSPLDADELIKSLFQILQDLESGSSIRLPAEFFSSQTVTTRDHEAQPRINTDTSYEQVDWSVSEIKVRDEVVKLAGVDSSSVELNRPSIFELGLDSIDAMKLATRLKAVGLRLPVSRILQNPTIKGIASGASTNPVGQALAANGDELQLEKNVQKQQEHYAELLKNETDVDGETELILPVTPMQEGLLVDAEKYHHLMVFKLTKDVDLHRLITAWQGISMVHMMMRTRFVRIDDTRSDVSFLQMIGQRHPPPEQLQCKTLEDAVGVLRSKQSTNEIASPVVRFVSLTEEEGRWLLLNISHAAYDAWSLSLLHQAVAKAYQNPSESLNSDQSSDSRLIKEHIEAVLKQANDEDSSEFWKKKLLSLPSTIIQTSSSGQKTAQLVQKPSDIRSSEILELCKTEGITLQSLGLAIWTLTLIHQARTTDVCFGLIVSGRNTDGSDELVFPTFNTVIFRPQLNQTLTKSETLRQVHDLAMQISEHQHFPLRKAIRMGKNPNPFNTLFTFQKPPKRSSDSPHLYEEVDSKHDALNPPYAVNVEMEIRNDQLVWTIATQDAIFNYLEIENLVHNMNAILTSFLHNPNDAVFEGAVNGISISGLPAISIESVPISPNFVDNHSATQTKDWTKVELSIRDVLAEMSNQNASHIGRNSSLFNLGLDSISSIKISGLLRQKGMKIPVSALIRAQTITKIAQEIERTNQTSPLKPKPTPLNNELSISWDILERHGIDRADIENVLTATSGQLYMLDMWSKSREQLFYPTFWFRVSGTSIDKISQAMKQLMQAVPLLRTAMVRDEKLERPHTYQVTIKSNTTHRYAFPWTYTVQQCNGEIRLAFRIHHALYDAISLGLMIEMLQSLCMNIDSTLSVNTDFKQFITTAQSFEGHNIENRQRFWQSYLERHPSKQNLKTGKFELTRVEHFEPELLSTHSIESHLRRNGLSIHAIFFVACAQAYSRLFQKQDSTASPMSSVILGVYLANRSLDIEDLPNLVAPTFNIVPLKVNLEASILESANQVQHDLEEISQAVNCGVSLHEIYDWTGVQLDMFVNFLRLPESLEKDKGIKPSVVITHGNFSIEERQNLLKMLPRPSSPFFNQPAENPDIYSWCLPSIDIEAKVEEGKLGVGIFAPTDMLEMDEILSILEGMKTALLSVS